MPSYVGPLHRALDVVWQHDPLSGDGARIHGGRFNPIGTAALYTSLTFQTAYHEANQGAGQRQPVTMVSYDANFDNLLELSTPDLAAAFSTDWPVLRDNTWRLEMKNQGWSRSQKLASRVINQGYTGMVVQSFAPYTSTGDLNVVLFRWGPDLPHQLLLVDDQDRIGTVAARSSTPAL